MIAAIEELAQSIPISQACAVFDFPRSSLYRRRQRLAELTSKPKATVAAKASRPTPARALNAEERTTVRELLNSERFVDQSPSEVYATLLDEGVYHCSIRTMYRILAEHGEVQERRNQLRHPAYTKPELLATGPNQLWSWDITKLRGPATWQYYYLYVILDVFSRYVVGWRLADYESAELAQPLIAESCRKQGIARDQLTLHADRGAAMVAKSLAQFLSDLGVDKSHSRPHTPDDNPFSEAQFKTMKYRPDYPQRFASKDQTLAWARDFFPRYNNQHHHLALGLLTPAMVHFGQTQTVLAQRQATLDLAYAQHPERFVRGAPLTPPLPTTVWINPPTHPQTTGPTPEESSLVSRFPSPEAGC
jgi:transposase InsO family protein